MPETQALTFTADQIAAFKTQFKGNASEENFNYFLQECQRRNLIPGAHVVFQIRTATEFDRNLQRDITVEKVTLITTIHALRLIAQRGGHFRGYGKFKYYYTDANSNGEPTKESNFPLGRIPHGVSVELYREGWRESVFAFARYDAYVQKKRDQTPTRMWATRGEEQLAKCAEALGLRMVEPEECGGILIHEEMEQANVGADDAPATTAMIIPTAMIAPPVNQAPATIQSTPPGPDTPALASGAFVNLSSTDFFKSPAFGPEPTSPVGPVPPVSPELAKLLATKPTVPPVAATRPSAPVPPPPAIPKPPTLPPPPAPGFVQPNRLPNTDGPVRETPAEIQAVADAVARDDRHDKPASTAAAPVAPPVASAPTDKVTEAQYQEFVTKRSAALVRDRLNTVMKDAGNLLKAYFLKQTGAQKLKDITAVDFERLLSGLEKATPADAANLIKEGVK